MRTQFRHSLMAGILLALAATAAAPETVWFAARGKTFHKSADCMVLSRTVDKFHADRKEAESHGLRPCAICYRAKKAAKGDNAAWGKK